MPEAAPIAPLPRLSPAGDDRTSVGLEFVVAVALGLALLAFGWFDTRGYLAGRTKPRLAFALNARASSVTVGPTAEFFRNRDDFVHLENFSRLINDGATPYRFGFGPVGTMEVYSPNTRARLGIRYLNYFTDQELTISCNGAVVEHRTRMPPGLISGVYTLPLHPGMNTVTFTYLHYNHDGTDENPSDPRKIGGAFYALDLILE